MVGDEEYQQEDYVNLSAVCYYCAFYFGPNTYGFCRRFEMWVKTDKTCVGFEANRNEW